MLPEDDIIIPLDIYTFEKEWFPLFERVKEVVYKVTKQATINEIVLIGGATRMPKIQKNLQVLCPNLNKTINPEEAVAKGAVIYAAMISGNACIKIGEFFLKK